MDASLVPVPKQRNTLEENARINMGEVPEDWLKNKRRQKDVQVHWTKKHGKSNYGYKHHISVDCQHKVIRKYTATLAKSTTVRYSKRYLTGIIAALMSGQSRPTAVPSARWN